MLALLRHPDQFALLRDDPSLIKTAIEELLRFDPPVQFTSRIALEEMTLDGGAHLDQYEQAVILLAAANRDPEQFPDPDRPRHHARRQPSSRVRLRHPLLPGRAARARRGPDRHRRDGPALPEDAPHSRAAAVQGADHAARPRRAAGRTRHLTVPRRLRRAPQVRGAQRPSAVIAITRKVPFRAWSIASCQRQCCVDAPRPRSHAAQPLASN